MPTIDATPVTNDPASVAGNLSFSSVKGRQSIGLSSVLSCFVSLSYAVAACNQLVIRVNENERGITDNGSFRVKSPQETN